MTLVRGRHDGERHGVSDRDVDGVVVVVAGTPWSGMASPERQLAVELARRWPLLWVDPSRSAARTGGGASRVPATTLRALDDELWLLSPVGVPGMTRPVTRRVAAAQRRAAIRKALSRLQRRAAVVLVAGLDDALDACPGAVRVFYGTDDYVAGAQLMGMSPAWSRRAERRQLARADVVIAVSEVLRARWSGAGRPPVTIPNGVDVALASSGHTTARIPLTRPIAGLVGHLNDRIDVDLLEAVAASGTSLLLVGPVTRSGRLAGLERLLAMPNVHATGHLDQGDLPAYYRGMDVGLTPYRDTPFNRASFPLKTLEYLAAGLPVVSTDLPASRSLATDLVRLATGPEQFVDAVHAATAQSGDPVLRARRRELASRYSWSRTAEQVLAAAGVSGTGPRRGAGLRAGVRS